MKVKIEIDTRTLVRFWLVVIGFGLVALAIYSSITALLIIGAALFFAIALSPSVNYFASIMPGKSRALSTAAAYVLVLLALGGIIFLAIPPIVEQFSKFAQSVPALVDTASKQYSGLNSFINQYQLQSQADKVAKAISDGATNYVSAIGTNLIGSIGSAFSIFTASILILVLTFLMLVEGPTWLDRIWGIYNNTVRMNRHKKLVKKMYGVVTGYVVGQLSISAIAGTVAGISVFILALIFGIPTNLAIPAATIIFVLSLIPLFGETIGNIIVSLVLLLNNPTAAVIFLIFFILYQQVEANYVSPKIQSKRNNLSALVILVAITIGIYLMGIIGAIISIPIAGCVGILAEDYFARAKKNREISNRPINKIIDEIQNN
jgi:predicted PurR-regulated permease PerM